jgi:DnaJ-class molecular chaperone
MSATEWAEAINLAASEITRANRAEARIKALEQALREWKCRRCDGKGTTISGFGPRPRDAITCPNCEGSGIDPIARAALAQTGEANG